MDVVDTYTPEQSPAADITHMWMVPKPIAKLGLEVRTHLSYILQQRLFLDDLLHRQCRSTAYWVTLISLSMAERARPLIHDLHDVLIDQDAGDGGVSASQAFADTLNIGNDTFLFPSVQSSTAAHPTHDLI